LIDAGVKRVVIPTLDPNPIVNGRGVRWLRKAGVEVTRGVLRQEAERANDIYFGRHINQRPYVILKSAQTLDGRIASVNGDSKWITSRQARTIGHRLRSEVDAVLVGSETVRKDNPSLTVRHFKGLSPYRIVVTASGRLPKNCRLISENNDSRTLIDDPAKVVERLAKKRRSGNLILWSVKTDRRGNVDIRDLARVAAEFGLHSLLIEGGGQLAASFLKNRLVDKHILFVAPRVLGSGVDAIGDLGLKKISESIALDSVRVRQVGPDLMITGYPRFGGK
jgi:diaminohydroxyphosphoribosylaminopyrimidine deaminase/5-amino-6-(5-phosphoribosylamino)uracil reductase